LDFRGVRFPLLYGPGDPYAYHYRNRLIENPALGKPVECPFPSDRMGNWLYMEDAATSLIHVLNADKAERRVYNIGGENHSLHEIANIVKKFIPNAEIIFAPKESYTGPRNSRLFHDGYARQELEWRPSYTMEEGIKETIEEIRRKQRQYRRGYHVKDRYV
jgi:dTDP-glucose 4,6-dehydratase